MPDTEGRWDFRTASNARSLDGLDRRASSAPPPRTVRPRPGPRAQHVPLPARRRHPVHSAGHDRVRLDASGRRSSRSRPCARWPRPGSRSCGCASSRSTTSTTPTSRELYPFAGIDRRRLGLHPARTRRSSATWNAASATSQALGIEADLILFHAYDRWGFSDMGPAADDRYVRYVVARLAAFQNVWWSLANEYDLLWSKTGDDWERFAGARHDATTRTGTCCPTTTAASSSTTADPGSRTRACSAWTGTGPRRTPTSGARRWGKPVVVDECAYEGDIDQGWGNITGEELVRRFWEGAVRGGYVGHGETYLRPGRGDLVVQGRGAEGRQPAAHRIPAGGTARTARPTGSTAALGLGPALGRRAGTVLPRVLRVLPPTVPHLRDAAGSRVLGRRHRHVEHDRRRRSTGGTKGRSGWSCPPAAHGRQAAGDAMTSADLPGGVLFGAAYYTEYQPYERLKEDLDLMAEADFTVIRVGESVWSTWEPRDGEFDLDWLAARARRRARARDQAHRRHAHLRGAAVAAAQVSGDRGAPAHRPAGALRRAPGRQPPASRRSATSPSGSSARSCRATPTTRRSSAGRSTTSRASTSCTTPPSSTASASTCATATATSRSSTGGGA